MSDQMTPAEVLEARDALAQLLRNKIGIGFGDCDDLAESIIRAGWTPPGARGMTGRAEYE